MPETTSTVELVLDLDPELGRGLSEEGWETARQSCHGKLVRVRPGAWSLSTWGEVSDELAGFLIVYGLLCREIALRQRHLFELLGPGDGLQPPIVAGGPRSGHPRAAHEGGSEARLGSREDGTPATR